MDYQVYDSKTKEVIAWLRENNCTIIVKDGYEVKYGDNLKAQDIDGKTVIITD